MFAKHCKKFLVCCDLREDLLELIIVKNSYYFIVAMWICIDNFFDKILKIASISINHLGDMKACKLLPTLFRIPRKSDFQQVAGLRVHPVNQYAIKTMHNQQSLLVRAPCFNRQEIRREKEEQKQLP
jgi:hypothetical protein